MRRCVLPFTLACLVLPASPTAAATSGGAPAPSPSGGAQVGQAVKQPTKLRVARFSIAPNTLQPGGKAARITYRIKGSGKSVRVRVDVVSASGKVARRLQLGWRALRRRHVHRWRLAGGELPPGSYVARLHAAAVDGRKLKASSSGRSTLKVVEKPVTVGSGVFPVRGPYSLGGEGSRFGSDRQTHSHQGQDISAAEGTPVVSPRAGTVYWRAYQQDGAGHYLVVRGDDGRDYVFMHLKTGSLLVDRGNRVGAGQQIAQVGNTGRSFGAHLHFEIWPGGWYATGSKPIDPLPDLLAWAGRG
jgi:murein DD-endopeptidase MepM/ murein hydrolase activator NlpD